MSSHPPISLQFAPFHHSKSVLIDEHNHRSCNRAFSSEGVWDSSGRRVVCVHLSILPKGEDKQALQLKAPE